MVDFIIGIVSYNPDIEDFEENLSRINFGNILVVDNGSLNINEIESTCKRLSVNLIKNKKNLGIAAALNQIFSYAKSKNFMWVLTLDQDSKIDKSILHRMKCCKNDQSVGIYCPQIYDYVAGEVWPNVAQKKGYTEIKKCITSGSLTSVEAWEAVNGFDEYLFIDEVDNDFCYRIRMKGYKILLVSHIRLEHKVGKTKVIKFMGNKIFVRNHSAMRKYYITRNRLYLDKKYYKKIRVKTLAITFMFILKTLIFEDKKFDKLKACNRGILDAFRVENQ